MERDYDLDEIYEPRRLNYTTRSTSTISDTFRALAEALAQTSTSSTTETMRSLSDWVSNIYNPSPFEREYDCIWGYDPSLSEAAESYQSAPPKVEVEEFSETALDDFLSEFAINDRKTGGD